MIQVTELATELKLHHTTVRYWINNELDDITRIKIKGTIYLSEEDALKVKHRRDFPAHYGKNRSGENHAKFDINYNWRRGLPTRISYGAVV